MKILKVSLISLCLSFISFSSFSGLANANDNAIQLEWRFDEEIFPSFILANATRKQPPKTAPNFFGDYWGTVGVSVVSPRDDAKVRLEVQLDQISEPSSTEVSLPRQGEKYFLSPTIRYRYADLVRIRQPITINAIFTLYVDNERIGQTTRAVRVRSVNDAPFARVGKNGRYQDYSWIFAAYVNENHPWIDQVLRQTLNIPVPIVRSFVGYQQGPREVLNQVFAIWYYFQRSGFTYSSITTPTGFTEGVHSQYVRFFEDSIKTSQSNCIDGTVLFASILRRIGIEPFIVLVPGHAFLGFYLDGQRQTAAYLETTAMNSQLNPYHQKKPTQFRDQLARSFQIDTKLQPAAQSFDYALALGNDAFMKAQAGFQSKAPGYRIISIESARRSEIQPINR
jgi:hypothetical protein